MKRITLLFAILTTVIGTKAQQEAGSWSITPRVGVNSSVLTMGDVLYLDVNGTETMKAGVQLGYLLLGKETLMGATNTNTDSFHRVNVSIPAGISYEYHNLVADLRYNIGVSNLCNHKLLDETWRSNSLWLTLGYQFTL